MKQPSKIKFVDEKLKESKGDKKLLYKCIVNSFLNIQESAFCGIQIPKRLIPREYVQKYNIKNLWKYDLPRGWRLLYTVINEEVVIVSVILEWLSHKEYEKRFRY